MNELVLTGLDGRNPIAFLAALGVLNALSDRAKRNAVPKLAWTLLGTYRPVVLDGPPREELASVLAEDLASFREEPAVAELTRPTDEALSKEDDLKPSPERFETYLRALVTHGSRRSLDYAAAFATDVARDKSKGNTKPTAFHFTAGNQKFLKMVSELVKGVVPADFDEALFGPWRYARDLPTLGWDNATTRDYALRATNPSKGDKFGVPGADWLAFRGLSFIRVAPSGERILTAGCRGEWKTGSFRWPIWEAPLSRSVVESLVTSREVFDADRSVLRARGISMVFESAIRRSDQGGYGTFSPASVAGPAEPGPRRRGAARD